jgi:hypothetical protein
VYNINAHTSSKDIFRRAYSAKLLLASASVGHVLSIDIQTLHGVENELAEKRVSLQIEFGSISHLQKKNLLWTIRGVVDYTIFASRILVCALPFKTP